MNMTGIVRLVFKVLIACVALMQPSVALTPEPDVMMYASGSATISPKVKLQLDEALATLKSHPVLQIEVAGHCDSVGSNAMNQSLSERRARAVYEYLVAQGVAESQLAGPVGYGETRPIADNGSETGRSRNRRVELLPVN